MIATITARLGQILPTQASLQKGASLGKSCMRAIVPAACAYDLFQRTRLFSLGSWSLASSLGLLVLYLPSLLKKGDEAVQEWIFERLKGAIECCNAPDFLFFLGLLRDVNRADKDGNTLLHHFFIKRRVVNLKLLVALKKRGADPFARNKNREMALIRARSSVDCFLIFFDCKPSLFQGCKTIDQICEILFPPNREKLPPNAEVLQAKVGDLSILQKFTSELSSQIGHLEGALSFCEIIKDIEMSDTVLIKSTGRSLTIEEIAKRILEICPLYQWLYEQANKPSIVQEDRESLAFQTEVKCFYDTFTHTIHIGHGKDHYNHFVFLIFETCNAILKNILMRVMNLEESGEINPEEGVFLREFVEHKTAFCCSSFIRGLKHDYPMPKELKDHWISVNKAKKGFMPHADTYRTNRNMLPFLEKNPGYLKKRTSEINR